MLWRRALSESGDLSPEEKTLQRRLALKRGESLQESIASRCPVEGSLPPLEIKQEVSPSADLTPLNSSKGQSSFRDASFISPVIQKQELPPLVHSPVVTPPAAVEPMSPTMTATYFGAPARDQFFQRYQYLSRQHSLQLSPLNGKQSKSDPLVFEYKEPSPQSHPREEIDLSLRPRTPDVATLSKAYGLTTASSPRSKYIYECISSHLNPRPSLLIRKKFSTEIRLEHYGMGDSMAIRLSAVLADLPMVTVLNLCDNNLTDVGLKPLLEKIGAMPNLVELNLSENGIGPFAADALGRYLNRRPATLRRLLLRKSNVDDFEGEKFVHSLIGNSSIIELDLSHNLLGHAELLNVVRPNFVTATEAIAKLLQSELCCLQELKLSWNMIRLDSAVQLSHSLAANRSLTYLDLSYNGIGQQGYHTHTFH